MTKLKLNVLESLRSALHSYPFRTEIEKGSICLYRPVRDRHSSAMLGMASAVCIAYTDQLTYKIYCVEQYNEKKELRKFSIKLATSYGAALRQYDLDTKRGPHIHHFVSGEKQKDHIPFSGNIQDVAKDMLSLINR